MKTSLTLALTAMIASGVLAQPEAKSDASAPPKKAAAQTASAAATGPLVPGPATVNARNVNVRGQPTLSSERVVLLDAGDAVTVLEEIVHEKPAANEPSRWARISLPAGIKVWVNGLFIDTTNKVVIVRRLNVRSGPGENFSVLGLLEEGDSIHEAGTVEGDWIQIEAPTNTYAFMAAEYLKQEITPAVVATAAPAPPITPTPTVTTVDEPPPMAAATAAPVETNAPVVFQEATPATTVPLDEAAIERAREATRRKLDEIASQERGPIVDEPPPQRIVSHEGVVRPTWSIQAPTKYALVDPTSGRTVNYLYTTSTNLDLSKWKGYRVVITGEEGLDVRWKNTPVLIIQKIHVLK